MQDLSSPVDFPAAASREVRPVDDLLGALTANPAIATIHLLPLTDGADQVVDFSIAGMNPSAAEMMGIAEEDAAGRSINELAPVHWDTDPTVLGAQVLKDGGARQGEGTIGCNGSAERFAFTAVRSGDGVAFVMAHAPRPHRGDPDKHLRLGAYGADYHFERGPAGQDRVLLLSDGARAVVGGALPSGSGSLRSLLDLVADDDRAATVEAIEKSADTLAPLNCQFRVRHDDATRWLSANGLPQRLSDGGTRWTGSFVDITTLKKKENELRDSQRFYRTVCDGLVTARDEATQAKLLAEQHSQAKSRRIAAMSHEIRTPLNAILGFAEVIREQMFGPVGHSNYHDYAGHILDSGSLLLDLVNEFLDVAKIEAGATSITLQRMNCRDILNQGLGLVGVEAHRRGVALACAPLAPDLEIVADPRAFRQVMMNLLWNALKFTPPGGTVIVGAEARPNGATALVIEDSGIGIPEACLPKIFEPFARSQHSQRLAIEGTGLGLAIVKQLVDLHGGTIDVRSVMGTGTTFVITFPQVQEPAAG